METNSVESYVLVAVYNYTSCSLGACLMLPCFVEYVQKIFCFYIKLRFFLQVYAT